MRPLHYKKLATLFSVTALAALAYQWIPGHFDLLRARLTLEDRGPTVVQRIQALSRLETVSFTEQKILEGRREWKAVPQWLAGDRLLFVAHGEVVAGIDLEKFDARQLKLEGDRAVVRLPRPTVFHVRLDNRNSSVSDRSTGWLNRPDPHLETEVRRSAEQGLYASALKGGILNHARQNAEAEVGRLLKGMGAKEVVFL